MDRKAISITQACQSVGVSRRTIYNWMAAGKVEYVRTAGGAVRIFEDTLWRDPQQVGGVTYRTNDTAADRGRVERV
ncbi:MAG TPA: excisionase family DNA-binding protein [Vicinamibacterales bacterium]|nr:excisionase family DNA-binding protein [Vicinamibacterales bacterium]